MDVVFLSTCFMRRVGRTVLGILCMASLVSCVKINLCVEDEHEHEGYVKVVYHWPEDVGRERPDSMLLFVNRVADTQWTGYVTETNISVDGGSRSESAYRDDDTIAVSAGAYRMFAFNNASPGYRFYNFYGDGEAQHLGAMGIHDFSISYVGYELTDPHIGPYGEDWVDFNPYTEYIATDVKPVYRAFNENYRNQQWTSFNVSAEEEVEVHLYPRKMTQDITFAFPIYTDEQVVVDSIIAEISGIPHKMYVCTGIVEIDTTYKMLFEFDVDRDNAKDVTLQVQDKDAVADRHFKQLDCMSTISVLGLLPNEDPTFPRGAGVLQLCIHSHVTDESGGVKRKNQYAKINMYNTIKNAHLLITDEQGNVIQNPGTYPELKRTDTLRIEDSRLIITEELILETYDDDNPLDTWVKDESGRLEVEV